jgi:hypothetical protein
VLASGAPERLREHLDPAWGKRYGGICPEDQDSIGWYPQTASQQGPKFRIAINP